jgi:uncharacterized membrane protein
MLAFDAGDQLVAAHEQYQIWRTFWRDSIMLDSV